MTSVSGYSVLALASASCLFIGEILLLYLNPQVPGRGPKAELYHCGREKTFAWSCHQSLQGGPH